MEIRKGAIFDRLNIKLIIRDSTMKSYNICKNTNEITKHYGYDLPNYLFACYYLITMAVMT
jgi:hypothetical protein